MWSDVLLKIEWSCCSDFRSEVVSWSVSVLCSVLALPENAAHQLVCLALLALTLILLCNLRKLLLLLMLRELLFIGSVRSVVQEPSWTASLSLSLSLSFLEIAISSFHCWDDVEMHLCFFVCSFAVAAATLLSVDLFSNYLSLIMIKKCSCFW